MDRTRTQRGGALIAAVITMMLAVTLAFSAASISATDRADLKRNEREIEARELAKAGVHRAIAWINNTTTLNPFSPLQSLDQAVFTNGDPTKPVTSTLATNESLVRNGRNHGTFTVTLDAAVNGESRDVTITATGYVPNAQNPLAKATEQAVVQVGFTPGRVFDYTYFINNWGWFYGDTINAYGNVASNGQFDAALYKPGAFGMPRWATLSMANPASPDLGGYMDDNQDGLLDGNDGSIYAGWSIINVKNVRGSGGLAKNQHSFLQQSPMPNLSDLALYEAKAKAANSSLMIGSTVVSDAVLGDSAAEKPNVVLIGTAANPIVLNGPVVVRGDVILKGVITGQGSIYAGRNIYIADNLTYKNGPTSLAPANNTEATTEAWIAANRTKDFCGLFARENIVMGNYTNATWNSYVASWLANSLNASKEDAGLDGIPNTRKGRDGILGTADDDVLEGDGLFTVSKYSQAHADLGLIPAGKNVGDVIPGTGEDIDGDGVFDGTITTGALALKDALTSGKYAGNLPGGTTTFGQISSINITSIQAVMYTNHAAAMTTLASGFDCNIFGTLVSRNESIIYGTKSLNFYFDRRLCGGSQFGTMLPRTLAPLRIMMWRTLNADVHKGGFTQVYSP